MGIKSFFAKTAANVALKAKVVAPHACVGFGIVGLVGAGVLACVQTVKHFDEIIDEHNEGMEKVRKIKEMAESGEVEIKKEEIQQGTVGVYLKTFYKGVKVYILPIGLAALSITSIIYGHGLLNKRYLATTAAFTALNEAYEASRGRARERFGEDIERNIFDDAVKEVVTRPEVDPETGEIKEKTEEVYRTSSSEIAKHPFVFMFTSDTSTEWSKFDKYNSIYISQKQEELNNILLSRGYVTLNEALCHLGMDPVQEGLEFGWNIRNLSKDGEIVKIDFGMTEIIGGNGRDFYLNMNVPGKITGLEKAINVPKKPRKIAVFRGPKAKGAKGDA